MKKLFNHFAFRFFLSFFMLTAFDTALWAQDSPKVEVNGNDVGNWFAGNWMWVTGLVVLLLILIVATGRRKSRTITTTRRNDGNVIKTTTTEIK